MSISFALQRTHIKRQNKTWRCRLPSAATKVISWDSISWSFSQTSHDHRKHVKLSVCSHHLAAITVHEPAVPYLAEWKRRPRYRTFITASEHNPLYNRKCITQERLPAPSRGAAPVTAAQPTSQPRMAADGSGQPLLQVPTAAVLPIVLQLSSTSTLPSLASSSRCLVMMP